MRRLGSSLLLHVTAELEPQRGEHAVLELGLAARLEAREQRRGEHVGGYGLVDRGVERPAPLARVGDMTSEAIELGRARERTRGEVEQPRADYAAAPPQLGDLGELEVVRVILRMAERSGFGVGRGLRARADV